LDLHLFKALAADRRWHQYEAILNWNMCDRLGQNELQVVI
jgi:hypothetical protein